MGGARRWDGEELLRREAPQVLAALVRRYGNFELAEESVQDALLEAFRVWPADGAPASPRGWILRVAQRRLIDALRSEYARTAREERFAASEPTRSAAVDDGASGDIDDSLDLLFLCCHPSLTPASAVALTLRAVGGLTTEEIASAFFTTPATMGQRISRAKAAIAREGLGGRPRGADFDRRVDAVLAVLMLMFSEGYAASGGDDLVRPDLCAEAIRLTRMLHGAMPSHSETQGLLALELLDSSRREARERDGIPVPLSEQDRATWDRAMIEEGRAHVEAALARGPLGRFQLLAAIAAVHSEAASAEDTDWPQVLALFALLRRFDPSPMARLSSIVALAHVHGPRAGLEALRTAEADGQVAPAHRVEAVRAHLLEETGDLRGAETAYASAARQTRSTPERRYLASRAARAAQDAADREADLRG